MCPPLSMMHLAGSRPSMLLLLNSSAHEPMTVKQQDGRSTFSFAKISIPQVSKTREHTST